MLTPLICDALMVMPSYIYILISCAFTFNKILLLSPFCVKFIRNCLDVIFFHFNPYELSFQ